MGNGPLSKRNIRAGDTHEIRTTLRAWAGSQFGILCRHIWTVPEAGPTANNKFVSSYVCYVVDLVSNRWIERRRGSDVVFRSH